MYRVLNRVPAGRIFSTGRALGQDLCDKDFVLVRLQQANMCYMPLSRFTGSAVYLVYQVYQVYLVYQVYPVYQVCPVYQVYPVS